MTDYQRIRLFVHCRSCGGQKPVNQSMSEWARLDAGLTERGLLIWCKRCRKTIFEFEPATLTEMLLNGQCAACHPPNLCPACIERLASEGEKY